MNSLPQRHLRVNPSVSVQQSMLCRAFLVDNPSTFANFEETLRHFDAGNFKLSKETFSHLLSRSLCMSGEDYAHTSQVGALLFKGRPQSLDIKSLESKAIADFLHNERRMEEVNARLTLDKSLPNVPSHLLPYFAKARVWLARRLPEVDAAMSKILMAARCGPGVTLNTVDPARSSYCYKYSEQSLGWYTLGQIYHLPLLSSSRLHQAAILESGLDLNPTIHGSNRVTFVPKNVTSLRSIAIEPNGQMMMQLGIHEYLSKVLSLAGNDIRDQSRNQLLARNASISGSHATIDLSAASDSLSLALVYQLFPSDWFMLFYRNRAPSGTLPDGSEITYHKLASMGNGMTFAIETLVFYALARAVCGDDLISVYGDDIIVPTQHSDALIELLSFVGFETNRDKTFLSGPFRESCGTDWYNGELVTPKYWRLSDKPLVTECYEFYNSCVRVAPRFNWGGVRAYILKCIKSSGTKLLFGPSYMPENSCIHAPETYLAGAIKRRWDKHLQVYRYRVIRFFPSVKRENESKPYRALAMLRHGTIVSELPLRRLGKYRVVWIA